MIPFSKVEVGVAPYMSVLLAVDKKLRGPAGCFGGGLELYAVAEGEDDGVVGLGGFIRVYPTCQGERLHLGAVVSNEIIPFIGGTNINLRILRHTG